MPLTLAHPAAVLLLRRPLGRFGVLSALVIGSVVPDLAYFMPFAERSDSHSLLGIATFCLPVGLACYAIHHLLIQPLLFAVSPAALRCRLPQWSRSAFPSAPLLGVAISLCVGALTHVTWDGFTHLSVVPVAPFLGISLFSSGGYELFGFKLLQHGSTVFGLLVLWRSCRCWFERALLRPAPAQRPKAWIRASLVGLVAIPGAVAGLAAGWPALDANIGSLRIAQLFVGTGIIAGGRVWIASTLLVGGGWLLWQRLGAPKRVMPGSRGCYRRSASADGYE